MLFMLKLDGFKETEQAYGFAPVCTLLEKSAKKILLTRDNEHAFPDVPLNHFHFRLEWRGFASLQGG
jgi:hypothetical protein